MNQGHSLIPAFLRQPVTPGTFLRKKAKPMQLRMKLTSAGWGLCILILAEFLMSINFSNNLIFSMTFLLLAIALIGWYHTRTNVTKLQVSDWRTDPVFAGQQAVYTLTLYNTSTSVRHALQAAALNATCRNELHLQAKTQAEIFLHRPAFKRGILNTLDARIRSSFPLGIFETSLHTEPLPDCLVYPVPQGDQPLPETVSGSHAHLKAESGTYTDMRRYSPGDPMSRIAWKAFARFDELYTKEFDGAAGQPALWLRWDDVRTTVVEQKLSQLCRWILDAHKQNREYGLTLPAKTIQPGDDESHLRICLSALALYGNTELS